ncbi:sigma-54-dependent Fis family transcriptional regulator [Burkholderia sp. Bp9012]|uniref:sigma 54-interacting transcriptional regulator n=1 Tax=Burkholderia sp. Bp9012 TaxID=2184562 RepID=UPI000F5A5E53|nr:sigma 54-interacting transcriptional regulator [Burkholderia sp. Bp9012]RQR68728.1 sigma-54-dependent Fis family transcriptional regulator [Burkholderia sp. Bp9012]
MTPPRQLNPLEVAGIARDMTWAAHPDELATVILQAAVDSGLLRLGMCYRLDQTSDCLRPLTCVPENASALPELDMDELDNPLVYSLVSGHPCEVERITDMVGVGSAFERLREHFMPGDGAWILPLRDTNQHAFAVLALLGAPLTLHALRQSALWQALLQIHERLFSGLQQNQGDAARARSADAVRAQAHTRTRERAARLLAAEFVGVSPAVRELRSDMLGMTDSNLAILVTGETGAGKDHAAWLIHQAGSRQGKFVPVNCAAIPKDLIEAELFGSERGAFTGASQARAGLVAEADGGTLFLDEIGDMPLELQGRLLRVLNEKRYRPVGATQERYSDFRLICATHQPLLQRIAEGSFREDLYFRIRQQCLHVPALRERPEDIPVLAEHVLLQYNRERQRHIPGISPEALRMLQMHPLPGNVRELRNLVLVAAERTERGKAIAPQALRELRPPAPRTPPLPATSTMPLHDLWETNDLPGALAAFECHLISERLRQANGSRALAAQSLGIPKRTLARRCQRWNIFQEDSAP